MNSGNVNRNRRSGGGSHVNTGRRNEFGEENGRRRSSGRVLQNPYLSAGAMLRRERDNGNVNGGRTGGVRGIGNGNGGRTGRQGYRSFEEEDEEHEDHYRRRRSNRVNGRVENPYSTSTRSRRRV